MVWNWIEAHSEESAVKLSLATVRGLFARGVPQETRQLTRQSASAKASAVWARFGEVEADPRIIAAAALAVVLRVASDHASGKAPGGEEFRDVQIAKLILRLAGGSVKRWPSRLPNGEPTVLRWFISSEGRVLRVLGRQAAEAIAPILDRHAEELGAFVEAGITALGNRKINPYPEQKRVKPKPPIPAELKSKSTNAERQTARKETGQPKVFRLETNGKLVRLS